MTGVVKPERPQYCKTTNLFLALRRAHLKKLRVLPKFNLRTAKKARPRRARPERGLKKQARSKRKQTKKRKGLVKKAKLVTTLRAQIRAHVAATSTRKTGFQLCKTARRSPQRRFARLLKLAR